MKAEAEKERLRKEAEAEKERLRLEEEAEKERLRLEEAEAERLRWESGRHNDESEDISADEREREENKEAAYEAAMLRKQTTALHS